MYNFYKAYCKDYANGFALPKDEFEEHLTPFCKADKITRRTNANRFYFFTLKPEAYNAYKFCMCKDWKCDKMEFRVNRLMAEDKIIDNMGKRIETTEEKIYPVGFKLESNEKI